jgi:ribosomal protein S12 methylthiotransferase accessory factor
MFLREETQLLYLPREWVPRRMRAEEIVRELAAPASRFKKPLSLRERLFLAWNTYAAPRLLTRNAPVLVAAGTPLNWRPLFNYLDREGVLKEPEVRALFFRNDKPKKLVLSLSSGGSKESDSRIRKIHGFGSGDVETAISKSVGELLERFVGTVYDVTSFPRYNIEEARKRRKEHVLPEVITKFSPEQIRHHQEFRYSEKTALRWARVKNLTEKRIALLPAQLMFWGYTPFRNVETEPLLLPITTNGLAGHFTFEEAALAAIREYVQRDAFLIYWMNTLSPRRIDLSDMPQSTEIAAMFRELAHYGAAAHFLDLTVDTGIPSVACVLITNESTHPIMTVGAGNGDTAEEAILNAYFEAIHSQTNVAENREKNTIDFSNYKPFMRTDIGREERIRLWHGQDFYERSRFFWSGEKESFKEFSARFKQHISPRAALDATLEHFRSMGKGYEVYAYEHRHPVLTRLGYHVVKVLIPELLPLHLSEHMAPLGGKRLKEVPERLGYKNAKLNPLPHPFP